LIVQHRRKRVRSRVLKAVSIDCENGESRYRFQPVDDMIPNRQFDRTWALAVLDRVLGVLADKYTAKGRARSFTG
jgi:hypothetical protein